MTKTNNKLKKILIATKNNDKFLIVAGLLKRAGLKDHSFVTLRDLDIREDIEENGSILNRAKQKADFFEKIILRNRIAGIEAVLGVDDGLKLPGRKRIISNSKEITDRILKGEIIPAGEIITIASAFVLKVPSKNIQVACVTGIPYVYLSNKENLKREEGKYVLNFVVGFLGGKKPLSAMSGKKCFDYYYKHSKKEFNKLCGVLLKK